MPKNILEEFLKVYIQISAKYLGKSIHSILYRAGEIVGEIYAKRTIGEIIIEFRKLEMNLTNKITQTEIRAVVNNSFEAKIYGITGKTSCYMLRGFFTAIWRTHLKSQFVQCEEVECLCKGDRYCLFFIKDIPPYQLTSVPIRERRTPFEVIEKSYIEVPIREEVFP